ncbi:putative benzoate 4-monooxygenase cytochrome P450 [Corynespora cassiicola Philippines]|uniref:Putative benzoate 4-monooxygenase cytochrome P450 n=1 Tax=Corynespora cassiicola Philippines TaxID=1448308 RepID=A0A2T2NJT5_CORCC|nr:putative benzoate 4-monooxygenase cytochrome P450 [Corynespora cassiicola Philippines]
MPSGTSIALALGTLVLTRVAAVIIYRLYLCPLKSIPGPLLQAVTNIPHDIACIRGTRHKHLEKLHAKYGPIVRVAPFEVSIIDNSIWRDVFGFRRNDVECPKGDIQERINGYSGILDTNRADHRRFRRLLAHAFSEQSLRQQEHRMAQQVDMLIAGLRKQSPKGPLDITLWVQWTTFDIMGDLSLGESFRSMEKMETHPWQQFLLDNIAAATWIGIAERWGFRRFINWLTPPSLMRAVFEYYELNSSMIMKRIKLGKERGDFLDHILKHDLIEDNKNEDIKGMHIEELKNTAGDIALAGSETTATLLAGLFYYLLMNPAVLDKVTEEVRTLPHDEDITIASTSKLPYFVAVLEEGLRIFPPAPLPACREIPPGGNAVGGYFFPAGTRVHPVHHVAYNSPLNFARPKEFIPERWMANRPEEFKDDNPGGVFQPFSYGPRNCIGNNLAKAEMRLILAKLLWHFDLSRPDPGTVEGKDWGKWTDKLRVYFLWHKPPLMVNIKERGDMTVKA